MEMFSHVALAAEILLQNQPLGGSFRHRLAFAEAFYPVFQRRNQPHVENVRQTRVIRFAARPTRITFPSRASCKMVSAVCWTSFAEGGCAPSISSMKSASSEVWSSGTNRA